VIAGKSAELVKDIPPAGTITRDIVDKAEALLVNGRGAFLTVRKFSRSLCRFPDLPFDASARRRSERGGSAAAVS
jgi:hypothetical protein